MYCYILVKNFDLELDLTSDGKGSSVVNTGQIFVTLNGIENLNMTNYPKPTSASPNISSSTPTTGTTPSSSSETPVQNSTR